MAVVSNIGHVELVPYYVGRNGGLDVRMIRQCVQVSNKILAFCLLYIQSVGSLMLFSGYLVPTLITSLDIVRDNPDY